MADQPRSATAPDVTADELLAGGVQPRPTTDEKVQHLKDIKQDMAARPAPERAEVRERVRRTRRERQQQQAEQDAAEAPMDPGEALNAFELMMSAERPAPPAEDTLEVPRLTARFGRPFEVTIRGLYPDEYEGLDELALREPTKTEQAAGQVGPVRDLQLFNRHAVVAGLLDPDLEDPEMLTKYGPAPVDVVRRWFNSGETAQLAARISQLTGFADRAVVDAKKS